MFLIQKGATDVTRYVKLVDSTAFTPETAYTITDLDLQYTRNRTAPAAKADATALAATDSAHADNKAIEIDATSSPGLYRIDWPDAAFATGADKVTLVVSGTGLDPVVEEIQLVDFDPGATAASIFTTQMTESYNADGTAPTMAQALFGILQRLTEFSISGTSVTVKKLNGSDTAMVLTLNSASAPTSSTRSS